jgi:hypothetical protein
VAITVQFSFDTAWATRIEDMVENYPHLHSDEVLQALLASVGKTWEELTAKQKWKVLVLRDTMNDLINHEGNTAANVARQTIIDDIETSFPLEIGPA